MKRMASFGMVGALALLLAGASHADLYCQLGVLTPDTLAGLNPATGEPWKVGDPYRLVFVSSTFVDPKNSGAGDIAYWNAAVQAIANNATTHDLSSVAWRIIGSSSTVAARDNTSTNPNVDGTGHAIFNMDGSTVIENNFVDLWNGAAPVNRCLFDQNVVHTANWGIEDWRWPLTGTRFDGVASGTNYLKDQTADGGGGIRAGRNDATGGGAGWIDANRVGSNWLGQGNAASVYGMSEVLTIQAPASTVIMIR